MVEMAAGEEVENDHPQHGRRKGVAMPAMRGQHRSARARLQVSGWLQHVPRLPGDGFPAPSEQPANYSLVVRRNGVVCRLFRNSNRFGSVAFSVRQQHKGHQTVAKTAVKAKFDPKQFMPKTDKRSVEDLHEDERAKLERLFNIRQQPKPVKRQSSSKDGIPTPERLALADDFYEVGDDRKGGKIYTFLDSSLARIYSRLVKSAKKNHQEIDQLRIEYAALTWYHAVWDSAGRNVGFGSMDLNGIHSADPSKRTGMPMADRQIDASNQLRVAQKLLGHRPGIVVDNVVCADWSLEVAGKALGWPSKAQAISAAQEILRDAGARLAAHRGIG